MSAKTSLTAGILFAALGVITGAFGAHALQEVLAENGRQATFETAVRYQFYHALALILCGVLMQALPSRHMERAGWCFTAGIAIFSGSLYILSLTNRTWLGAVTPFGGLFFIAGWAFLLVGVVKK